MKKQEKKLGADIYAKRIMAMRMDEMIRETETPDQLQKKVEEYTGKKLEAQPIVTHQEQGDMVGWEKEWKASWEEEVTRNELEGFTFPESDLPPPVIKEDEFFDAASHLPGENDKKT